MPALHPTVRAHCEGGTQMIIGKMCVEFELEDIEADVLGHDVIPDFGERVMRQVQKFSGLLFGFAQVPITIAGVSVCTQTAQQRAAPCDGRHFVGKGEKTDAGE